MRLHILGDLHFEFGPTKIPETDADVVVLAGDILLGRDGHLWARNQFFAKPVIYVLGNHEFYRHSLPELTETVKRETEGSNIHLLENSAVEIDGYTFLGCTLWTDFQLDDDPEGAMRVADALMLARKPRQGEGGFGGLGSTSARYQAAVKTARSRNGTRVPSVSTS
jgi:hypothetical protein